VPKQASSVSNYLVESRSQIAVRIHQTAILFYLRRYDLPDKRPWPYRKLGRLPDRTKRRKAEGKKSTQTQAKRGEVSRGADPRLLILKATWQPDAGILTAGKRRRKAFRSRKREKTERSVINESAICTRERTSERTNERANEPGL